MAQDAFVRAFRALHTFRGDSAFSTWLTAIAMNVYRSALRERPPMRGTVEAVALRADNPGPLEDLETRERLLAVRQMVSTLPPRYREPIVLYYFQDMNVAETARILGIAEGTVKARLHRGKQFLRRRLMAAKGGGRPPETERR
jgi:RNA polymerase sigma-70 factor (ECF subfamily)